MNPFPFIDAVMANLADAAPKLVYADWLDEHGFANRAGFVRYLGRTGRYPRQVEPPSPGIGFYPEHDLVPAQHRLPNVFSPWLFSTFVYTDYPKIFHSWNDIEVAGALAWVGLVTGPPRRYWFLPPRPWTPDYTPVAHQDPKAERLMQWERGVR